MNFARSHTAVASVTSVSKNITIIKAQSAPIFAVDATPKQFNITLSVAFLFFYYINTRAKNQSI